MTGPKEQPAVTATLWLERAEHCNPILPTAGSPMFSAVAEEMEEYAECKVAAFARVASAAIAGAEQSATTPWFAWPARKTWEEVRVRLRSRDGNEWEELASDFEYWMQSADGEMCDDVVAFQIIGETPLGLASVPSASAETLWGIDKDALALLKKAATFLDSAAGAGLELDEIDAMDLVNGLHELVAFDSSNCFHEDAALFLDGKIAGTVPEGITPEVEALIAWARDNQAFPKGNPGGCGRGHIDENECFVLRDLITAIDASRLAASPEPVPATNQAGEVREAANRLRAGIDGLYTKRGVSFSTQDWSDIDTVVNAALAQPSTRSRDNYDAAMRYTDGERETVATQPATSQCCGCGAELGAFHNSKRCLRKLKDEPLVTLTSCDDGRSGAVPSQEMINAGWAVFPEGEEATEETLAKAWTAMWRLSQHALATQPATSQEGEEIVRIVKWIDEAIERAKRHGATEGVWLFGSQWRSVRAILAATPTPPTMSEDLREVLEFYADRDGDGYRVDVTNYGLSTEEGEIVRDGGKRARAALARAQGQAS